jgi:hypothetical protein
MRANDVLLVRFGPTGVIDAGHSRGEPAQLVEEPGGERSPPSRQPEVLVRPVSTDEPIIEEQPGQEVGDVSREQRR